MQNGVTFWTEGGPSVGMGHLMRCINIARALEAEDVPVHFLVNSEKSVTDRLNSEALFHITYPMTGRHAGHLAGGIVVIDSKRDMSVQVHSLKEEGKKVVLIDNASSEEADAVVMPTPAYRGAPCRNMVSGSEYVIIGDGFRRARGEARPGHSLPLKALVTMGGADPFNLTEMALKALSPVDRVDVTAVIGPAFRAGGAFEDSMAGYGEKVRFVRDVKDMAPLMNDAHIALAAMGTTVYELAYMGVPSVLIGNYEDDRADIASLHGLGICRGLGPRMSVSPGLIREAVESLRDDEGLWLDMSARARRLTDGRGASRIAGLIVSILKERQHLAGGR